GRTLYQKWASVLTERVESKKRSIRALHLNPDSTAFAVVQETWGIAGSAAAQAQRERPRAAMDWLKSLFVKGKEALILELKKDKKFCSRVNLDSASLS